ncbi:MAG: hypothetical protein LBI27_03340 [Clostridiales bacterium]|jgi:hemerythrin-like metal-binding protein|nr:hypothetical protein [Clostridiales bacterium]
MLWKPKFCIGEGLIDEQHEALFKKVGELLDDVNMSVEIRKQECIDAILFLKDYAVKHFAAEEAYQKRIGYPDFDAHKDLHEKFVKTVLWNEKKMVTEDFSEKSVKSFTGMLVAWLLYHVADADQKIGEFAKQTKTEVQAATTYDHSEIVCRSVVKVLKTIAELDTSAIKKVDTHNETFAESLAVELIFDGEISGYVAFVYPGEFVKKLIYSFMHFTPKEIDELVISALFEISGIMGETICRQIAAGKRYEMKPPFLTSRSEIKPDEIIAIDTGIGVIEVDFSWNN